jgi:hypothetical protein
MKCIFQETLFHALQEWTCPPPQDHRAAPCARPGK